MTPTLDQLLDRAVVGFDTALRTLTGNVRAERPSPAAVLDEPALSASERRRAAGLMRVNHTGEVCAQALYEGQALTARDTHVGRALLDAADEEVDHLAWCRERIAELGGHTSYLNPIWYGSSFALGAVTGLLGDRASLGFVAATEEQVCSHLERHLERLPAADARSRAIVVQMHADEKRHGVSALQAGGADFPAAVKRFMTLASKAMTETSYRL